MPKFYRPLVCAGFLLLTACTKTHDVSREPPGGQQKVEKGEAAEQHKDEKDEKREASEKGKADVVRISSSQIAASNIEVAPVRQIFADSIEAPATIEASPSRSEVVAVSVGGRITALERNLGEPVQRGDVLAVVESAEAAQLKADVEAARRDLDLARVTLQREERLYKEKVSAEQDYIAAKAAAAGGQTRLRLAEQRLAAAGGSGGGPLNRLIVRSPIKGYVIARPAVLGNVVGPNTELFRIADLSEVSVELALSPEDASRVQAGAAVDVSTPTRNGTGRIAFISRVIDPTTRQVQALATLTNAQGVWRVGETVRATVLMKHANGQAALAVPQSALQTVEDKPSVFVRTSEGFAVKPVVLGPANSNYVTVASGLTGDERVAVTNSYVLKAELGKGKGGDDD
jgi:cobalt-zinc-cadmium efflux system membrane fusion protein